MIIVIVYYLFNYAYFIPLVYAKACNIENILFHSFTGSLRVVTHISAHNKARKSEYSSLQFRIRLLICAGPFGTVKREFGALYSRFMGRWFTFTARDALPDPLKAVKPAKILSFAILVKKGLVKTPQK
jgi:hypothetical protein